MKVKHFINFKRIKFSHMITIKRPTSLNCRKKTHKDRQFSFWIECVDLPIAKWSLGVCVSAIRNSQFFDYHRCDDLMRIIMIENRSLSIPFFLSFSSKITHRRAH